MEEFEWYVGIDEVGRGPLAGPVTVCAVALRSRNTPILRGIKDSKKLTEKKRREWVDRINSEIELGDIIFSLQSSDHGTIDELGITESINLAIKEALKEISLKPDTCKVLLDGGLKAPEKYPHQETIIRGDEKEQIIATASVLAKVHRDAFMCEQAILYPKYGFGEHKGYGTSAHYEAIKKYGPCKIHRRSFLGNFL